MHMRTDHDECVAILFCDLCIVTLTVATFSPVFAEVLAQWTVIHASCAQSGRPSWADVQAREVHQRLRGLFDGNQRVVDLVNV